MSATLSQSAAILKRRYPDGKLPKSNYQLFPYAATVAKQEDWEGDDKAVALQTENPQGSSADFPTALGSLQQGAYSRFLVTRVQHFGIARIQGQALKAAAGKAGALVDLWQNETDGISQTELKCIEVYSWGVGDGVLGTVASGAGTATVTLTRVEDITKFDLGMRLQALSAAGFTAVTLRSGYARVTGIDRRNGTLTILAGNWSDPGNIPGFQAGDVLVRAGDGGGATGSPVVLMGVPGYIAGSGINGATPPGTLFGLPRNADPVRLAGQVYNATGVPYEDAMIEAESIRNLQFLGGELEFWSNPRDIAQMKKQAGGKSTYPRTEMKSTVAGVSFSGIEFNGDMAPVKIMCSPFITRNQAFMLYKPSFALASIGPAPQMLDFDGSNFLRVANDDAYDVRFGGYWNQTCNNPVASIQVAGFGL